jgi:hypothetical protein
MAELLAAIERKVSSFADGCMGGRVRQIRHARSGCVRTCLRQVDLRYRGARAFFGHGLCKGLR